PAFVYLIDDEIVSSIMHTGEEGGDVVKIDSSLHDSNAGSWDAHFKATWHLTSTASRGLVVVEKDFNCAWEALGTENIYRILDIFLCFRGNNKHSFEFVVPIIVSFIDGSSGTELLSGGVLFEDPISLLWDLGSWNNKYSA
ncbi:hypothetical protein ACJX0J_009886, partial [Zea mays]